MVYIPILEVESILIAYPRTVGDWLILHCPVSKTPTVFHRAPLTACKATAGRSDAEQALSACQSERGGTN
jgi:hypothetical protein